MYFIRRGSSLCRYGVVHKDNVEDWAYYMLDIPAELRTKLKPHGIVLDKGDFIVATCPTVWKGVMPSKEVFEAPIMRDFVDLLSKSTSNCIIVNNISDTDVLLACSEYSLKLRAIVGDSSFHVIYNIDLTNADMLLDESFFQYFDVKSSIFTFILNRNILKPDVFDTNIIRNIDIIQWLGATYPVMLGVHPTINYSVMLERYLVSEGSLFRLSSE